MKTNASVGQASRLSPSSNQSPERKPARGKPEPGTPPVLRFLALALCLLASGLCLPAWGQPTAFTYQGRLNDSGLPANGLFDLRFQLFASSNTVAGSAVGSAVTNLAVPVSNGLFTVTLDLGAGVFTGADRWLEIGVRPGGGKSFESLTPRQPITSAPYAITAGNLNGVVPASGLSGNYGNAVTFSNPANNFSGTFGGNGSGVTNVNAATLDGLDSASFWKLDGNAGANPANGLFLGSTDNQPLEFKVNGLRALRLEPNTNGAPNVIGGLPANLVAAGVIGATIAGGGRAAGFDLNAVLADYGTVVGGYGNTASGFSSTVGGGSDNTASGYASTVGGGSVNTASENFSTVGGGAGNTASERLSTVGGGNDNTASGTYSTVGGGADNTASGNGSTVGGGIDNTASGIVSTVPGGGMNAAAANYSFAAGRRAKANHPGSFVWADSSDFDFASTVNNVFLARCVGGVRFTTGINASGGTTAGVRCAQGESAWESVSDRNAKQGFQPVSPLEVLEKIAAMPITRWTYKANPANEHIGPVAQDFRAAFGLGSDDKHISTIDADGVALAAIQGLNQKLREELKRRDAENAELQLRLEKLEHLLNDKLNGGDR